MPPPKRRLPTGQSFGSAAATQSRGVYGGGLASPGKARTRKNTKRLRKDPAMSSLLHGERRDVRGLELSVLLGRRGRVDATWLILPVIICLS